MGRRRRARGSQAERHKGRSGLALVEVCHNKPEHRIVHISSLALGRVKNAATFVALPVLTPHPARCTQACLRVYKSPALAYICYSVRHEVELGTRPLHTALEVDLSG